MFAEVFGTFFLVVVAARADSVNAVSLGEVGRVAAVVAPWEEEPPAILKSKRGAAVTEMSSEDGEKEELDQDHDDDGWESESDDDS
ncbi:MAG: hypothetical protein ACRD6W_05370 [Nitrososphaerales archaeon]